MTIDELIDVCIERKLDADLIYKRIISAKYDGIIDTDDYPKIIEGFEERGIVLDASELYGYTQKDNCQCMQFLKEDQEQKEKENPYKDILSRWLTQERNESKQKILFVIDDQIKKDAFIRCGFLCIPIGEKNGYVTIEEFIADIGKTKKPMYAETDINHMMVYLPEGSRNERNRKEKMLLEAIESTDIYSIPSRRLENTLKEDGGIKPYIFLPGFETKLSEKMDKFFFDETGEDSTDNYSMFESECFADIVREPYELSPCLIDGILRQGHKMILSSRSKAGKSFLLMELSIAIAMGSKWLGYQCKQGKVLYVNLEIDPKSFRRRIENIFEAQGIDFMRTDISCIENLKIINLRGKNVGGIENFIDGIIGKHKNDNLSAVIIDPIYKVMEGDENNASDMGRFVSNLDRLAEELNTSVIYCHHHSKGGQSGKNAMDRSSGSGVFSRDADAIIDLIELNPSDDVSVSIPEGATLWRLESILREFPPTGKKTIIYKHPLHYVDESFSNCHPMDTYDKKVNAQRGSKVAKERKNDKMEKALDRLLHSESLAKNGKVLMSDAEVICDAKAKTIKEWLSKCQNIGLEYVWEGGNHKAFIREKDFEKVETEQIEIPFI